MTDKEYVVLRDRSEIPIGIVEKRAAETIVNTIDWATAGTCGEIPRYSISLIDKEAQQVLEDIRNYSARLETQIE